MAVEAVFGSEQVGLRIDRTIAILAAVDDSLGSFSELKPCAREHGVGIRNDLSTDLSLCPRFAGIFAPKVFE